MFVFKTVVSENEDRKPNTEKMRAGCSIRGVNTHSLDNYNDDLNMLLLLIPPWKNVPGAIREQWKIWFNTSVDAVFVLMAFTVLEMHSAETLVRANNASTSNKTF